MLAPAVGLEPTTTRLTAGSSTIELRWNVDQAVIIFDFFSSVKCCFESWNQAALASTKELRIRCMLSRPSEAIEPGLILHAFDTGRTKSKKTWAVH
jgi:hypothetical protein